MEECSATCCEACDDEAEGGDDDNGEDEDIDDEAASATMDNESSTEIAVVADCCCGDGEDTATHPTNCCDKTGGSRITGTCTQPSDDEAVREDEETITPHDGGSPTPTAASGCSEDGEDSQALNNCEDDTEDTLTHAEDSCMVGDDDSDECS